MNIAETAIRLHNKLTLPENLDQRTRTFAKVLRDADKCDIFRVVCDMPLEQRRSLPGLQPNRADIIVHGVCILMACMRTMGIGEITVSEYGNLEGYVKRTYCR